MISSLKALTCVTTDIVESFHSLILLDLCIEGLKSVRYRIKVDNNTCGKLLPTARKGNVFRGLCHSVHNQPYGYSVTAHPCYGAVGTHPAGMRSC